MSQQPPAKEDLTHDTPPSSSSTNDITDEKDLVITTIGFCSFVVTNEKHDTAYTVNLRELSCTCPDHKYRQDEPGVCKHVLYANRHGTDISIDEILVRDVSGQLNDVRDDISRLESVITSLEAAVSSETTHNTRSGASKSQRSTEDVDPTDAANDLREAFDERLDSHDMQVVVSDGLIWISTGPQEGDTPDWVFDSWIKNADVVDYIADDHDLADERPEAWLKNALDPRDVDAYISEVLG